MDCTIQNISITNIKGMSKASLDFHPRLTVLVGNNGIGKTTIIESIRSSWSAIASLTKNGPNVVNLGANSVRIGAEEGEVVLSIQLGEHGRKLFSSGVAYNGRTRLKADELETASNIRDIRDVELPILVYYGQERGFKGGRQSGVITDSVGIRNSSLQTATQSIPEFIAWFDQKDTDEAREVRDRKDLTYRDPELESIRKIVKEISGFSGINLRQGKIQIDKGGVEVELDSLSSGERVFFVLAIDLARRLMVSNSTPTLSNCKGIVLIDEVDLHLHPNWQHEILRRLTDTFPNCQFIVTTHSPQVLSGVDSESIRLLKGVGDGCVTSATPKASRGRDINYILEGLFDSDEREPEADELLSAFDKAVEQRLFFEAEKLIERLKEKIEGSSSAISIRQAKLERLKRK